MTEGREFMSTPSEGTGTYERGVFLRNFWKEEGIRGLKTRKWE